MMTVGFFVIVYYLVDCMLISRHAREGRRITYRIVYIVRYCWGSLGTKVVCRERRSITGVSVFFFYEWSL